MSLSIMERPDLTGGVGRRSRLEECLGMGVGQFNRLVADLRKPRMSIYWTDLLLSLSVGYGAWWSASPGVASAAWQIIALMVATLALYRASVFVHEVAHLPRRDARLFRNGWDILCGIPLLIPSIGYDIHAEHHAGRLFGTVRDGEYVRFASLPRRMSFALLGASLVTAPFLVLRFLILAPVGWIVPRFRSWLIERASSLVISAAYRRPAEVDGARLLAQEVACFLWCATVAASIWFEAVAPERLIQAYLIVTGIAFLNAARTLIAHRYEGDGAQMSFVEQVLDSNTFPGLTGALWAPVGLRYHAVHHLLPAAPYHALGEIHRRLMRAMPPDAPFRRTVRGSPLAALAEMFVRRRPPAPKPCTTMGER